MKSITVRVIGVEPLLQNNPQMVDPFNKYKRMSSEITSKRKKTDEDLITLREIELQAKVYFDEIIGIYVPAPWVIASIAGNSWSKCKIKKADIRSCVFVNTSKIKLNYTGSENVKEIVDIANNPEFHNIMNLKQAQVRIVKAVPIFHDWSFECEILFDDTIINESDIKILLEHGAKFGGYGDFRPTYGRARVEFL